MAAPTKRNLDDFRKVYDKSLIIPARIKAALADLGDAWETEQEFLRRVACSTTEFARYRDPFIEHSVEIPRSRANGSQAKRVWAGTKQFAAKLRASVVQ